MTRPMLKWPKRRGLTAAAGLDGHPEHWAIEITPGRLTCWTADGHVLAFTDQAQLRAYAYALYAAVLEHDLIVKTDAAKASWARRNPGGKRHRPVQDTPEPPAHMSLGEEVA